jgi:hypothetical protein
MSGISCSLKHGALLVLGTALFSLSACETKTSASENGETAATEASAGKGPVLAFDQPEVTLADLTEGDTVQHVYTFKNTGTADLQIFSASASCGCTVPSYPEKPVPPGGTGAIKVVFNSKNKVGTNTKTVTIYANTQPETTSVSFKVNVLEDPAKKKEIL